jgi:hypothetical protein
MSYQPFTKQDINNNTLSAIKSMPLKNSTSDGTSTFEMGRKVYIKTYQPSTAPVVNNKKWLGNRDASQVATNRRNSAIGLGTINAANQPMSFNTNDDKHVRNTALNRVRSGGAVAPLKKNANLNNAPTPWFPRSGFI